MTPSSTAQPRTEVGPQARPDLSAADDVTVGDVLTVAIVVLTELEHDQRAMIYAEVVGYVAKE